MDMGVRWVISLALAYCDSTDDLIDDADVIGNEYGVLVYVPHSHMFWMRHPKQSPSSLPCTCGTYLPKYSTVRLRPR